jgi:hypothetical protein
LIKPKEKVESNKVVMEKVSLKLSYEWKTIAPLTMDEKMEMSKRYL